MLEEILRSLEQVAQQLSISFHLHRVISANNGWLQVRIECFVPGPPLVTIREKGEYPAFRVKPAHIVSDPGTLFSGIVNFSQFGQSL